MQYLKIIMAVLPGIPLERNTSNRDSTCLQLLAYLWLHSIAIPGSPLLLLPHGTRQEDFFVLKGSLKHRDSTSPLRRRSTAHNKTPWKVWSTAQIRGWTMNKPCCSPGKRQMWFLGLVCIQARCHRLQEGKICNKQNLCSWPWQSYPGATHSSGWLRSVAGQLGSERSSSDSLLFLCQMSPGTERSLPIRNLEGTRFPLWHLHHVYFSIW